MSFNYNHKDAFW